MPTSKSIMGLLISVSFAIFISGCDLNSESLTRSERLKGEAASKSIHKEEASSHKDMIVVSPVGLSPESELARSALIGSEFALSSAPKVKQYKEKIRVILASDIPILALQGLSDEAMQAQSILLRDERLPALLKGNLSDQAIRTEVMTVLPAHPGDLVGLDNKCSAGDCYRINAYNFFYNATLSVIVNIKTVELVSISSMPESQPDLSLRLERLASSIAKHEPLVQQEIERYLSTLKQEERPEMALEPLMASTKSSLRNTLCERSKHLCVAPTFVLGDTSLWVIVDLTDFKVVGVRWTALGLSGPPTIVTERKLENEYVFENFCERVNSLSRNGWSFDYHITTSDGLRVADIKFKGKRVLKSVKVVDWHISYSGYDRFGFSDATGCPMFSSAVVVAYKGPKIDPIIKDGKRIGFSIAQDFRQLPWPAPCNYRYEEKYEFYDDGRYRVAVSNHGRGCGVNGTYRPVIRLDYGRPSVETAYTLEQWRDKQWLVVTNEMWAQQGAAKELEKQMYSHRITAADGSGFLMAPASGQFDDNGRGDNAFIYATVGHDDIDEGARDLVTLGDCCNTDFRQGPEKFLQPAESLSGESLVLWYVPQLENDGGSGSRYCWADVLVVDGVQKNQTWPCTGGPMFLPIGGEG